VGSDAYEAVPKRRRQLLARVLKRNVSCPHRRALFLLAHLRDRMDRAEQRLFNGGESLQGEASESAPSKLTNPSVET